MPRVPLGAEEQQVRRIGLVTTAVLVGHLALASPALAAGAPPVDPSPAPGLPAETNQYLLGVKPTGKPTPKKPTPAFTLAQYRAQKPAWSPKNCTAPTRALAAQVRGQATVECATVKTPLSWANLSLGSMDLHISRVPATERRARTLFVNPGGPGMPAGPMSFSVAIVKPALHRSHTVVGVDPRGTGGSTPLPCDISTLGVRDSRDTSPAQRRAAQAGSAEFVRRCVQRQGRYLPHITTVNTVADQDLVRQLLVGPTSTVDWYGVSGGSWMGAWFAQLHPKSLGRVVLDANTEFTADWRTSFSHYPRGFQRRFEGQFLPWAARHNATYKAGATPEAVKAAYERVRAAAGRGAVGRMTPDGVDGILTLLLYSDGNLPTAAQFIAGTDAQLRATGRAEPALPPALLAQLSDAQPETVTVRTAILCNDTPYTRTAASYERELNQNLRTYPLAAGTLDMLLSPCAAWPYPAQRAPRIDGTVGPMKLMVQPQFDPATPLEGALRAHTANVRTRLLTVRGEGSHGGYLASKTCTDRVVTRYLTTGVMPRRDTTCAGDPLPGDDRLYPVTWRP